MNIISQYKHRLKATSLTLLLFLGVIAFNSCSSNDDDFPNNEGGSTVDDDVATFAMHFETRAVGDSYMDNARLFVFNTDATPKYLRYQLTKRDVDTLKATMTVGTYNLVLLSANKAYTYITPTVNNSINSELMFKLGTTLPAPNDTILADAPELRYDLLKNVPIVKGQTTLKKSTLNRNVVKIRVILDTDKSAGIAPSVGQNFAKAFVSLYNIPTSLNWDGNFALNATNKPVVDTRPLRKAFNVTAVSPKLKVDTLDFIVPAHRGNEFKDDGTVNPLAVGFSHKFKVRIGLPVGDGTMIMIKEAEVSDDKLLRPNHEVHLKISFAGEVDTKLNIEATVVPWNPYIDQDDEIGS